MSQGTERTLRILLLEDLPADAELISSELHKGGIKHVCKRVVTRADFLEALPEFKPDLIVCNCQLPGFTWAEALRVSLAEASEVPFVLMTSGPDGELAAESIKQGAADYIHKKGLFRLVPVILRAVREGEQRAERQRAEELLKTQHEQLIARNEALQQSEERFRQFAENIREVFWMTDPEKRQMIYISPGYEQIWGRSCESLYASPGNWIEAIHPEDRQRVLEALTTQRAGGYNEVYRILRPDGSVRWIHDRAFPVRNQSAMVYRVAGIAEDITDRKLAEARLTAAEANYRGIFENAVEGIFQSTPEGTFLSANPALARILGYGSPKELLGTVINIGDQLCVEPASRLEFKRRLETEGSVRDFETEVYRKDKSKIWISINARAVRDARGGVLLYEGTTQDVTARKQAEHQVATLAHAVESIDELISITDHENRFTFVNRAFVKAYGYSEKEILGRQPHFLYSRKNPPGLCEQVFEQTVLSRWSGEILNCRKDGAEFPIYLSTSPIKTKEGVILGLVGVGRDISERKRAEKQTAAFSWLGYRLSAAATPTQAAEIILRAASDLFGWDAGYVHLYSLPEDRIIPVLTIDTVDGKRAPVPATSFTLDPSPFMRAVMEHGGRLINRSEESELAEKLVPFGDAHRPSASMMYVPVHSSGTVLGILSIQSYSPQAYSKGDLVLLQALADQCGGAFHRIEITEALRESEEKFRTLFESAPIGIALHNSSGRFLHTNATYQRMLGYSNEELKQSGVKRITHPDDILEGQQMFADLQSGKRNQYHREKRYLRKDGRIVWAQSSASAIRSHGGQLLYIISMVEDISERKQFIEALRQSERKLRLIAENTSDVIFAFDMERQPVYANAAVTELTGYSFAEIQEKKFINWIHPEDQERMLGHWEELFVGKAYSEVEFRLVTKSGQEKWCSSSWGPLLDETGRQIGVQGRERDISERKQLESEVLASTANERRRIGHELHDGLGQYLAGIAFRAKALEQMLTTDRVSHAAEARELAGLLSNAISQTRSLARGLDPVDVETIGLTAALQNLSSETRKFFKIGCSFRRSESDLRIDSQASLALYRIVQEAIHNAITHGEATQIEIELAIANDRLCLRVQDNGTGFEFEPGMRAGMGLRVMDYRARSIGASLKIDSQLNGGTEIRCLVPLRSNRAPAKAGDDGGASRSHSISHG